MHQAPAPVVVVGAGPAGLAVARALARRDLETTVLERDRVASSWAHHYAHLKLHTRKGAAALPGMPYPADTPTFPRRDDVVAYLRAYGERFVPDLREGVDVRGLTPRPAQVPGAAGWRLETSAGELEARAVVVATGIASAPFTPAIPGADAVAGSVRHAADNDGVEIRNYRIIYEVLDDFRAAAFGMLEPIIETRRIGAAEVLQVFRISRIGAIAGSRVLEGELRPNADIVVTRDGQEVHRGKITSLRHYDRDVSVIQVANGRGLLPRLRAIEARADAVRETPEERVDFVMSEFVST